MAKEDIRQFRHDIATLKRKGLVTNVDARSVKPTSRLRKLIDRFDNVLSGKATPVKLPKSEAANLKANLDVDVYKGKVIYPHSAGEKVGVTHGHAYTREPKGIERVTIPIREDQIEKYITNPKNRKMIDAMKRKDEFFAFRFHGNKSTQTFSDVGLLLQKVRSYKAFTTARKSGSSKDMQDNYRNLEIVKVHRTRDWKEAPGNRTHTRSTKLDGSVRWKKRSKKLKKNPELNALVHAEHAEVERARRSAMSASQKEAYKAAARKRAAKSRRKHAQKKKTRRT